MMSARRHLIQAMGAMACCLHLPAARAEGEIHLVVQASNPIRSLTQKEAVDLYTGRTRAFANGELALLFDLPRESPERAEFYRRLTGMSIAQINSYWARLMFSGQVMPPQSLPTAQAMLDIVRRNPSALGYLSAEPGDKDVRTVLVLKGPGS